MALDLETLRGEITEYLSAHGFVTFFGTGRTLEPHPYVYWDTGRHGDFHEFLHAAREVGARLIVLHTKSLSLDQIDEALDRLEESTLSREDRRRLELNLRELRAYEGFTCSLELSFICEGCIYLFELHTDWFETLTELLEEVEEVTEATGMDEGGDDPMSGYFSRN